MEVRVVKLIDIPEARAFILHWGEMGSHWGVNRSVSQVHALLYLSREPLHAEDICETLGLARSNVSTALKELQSYGIVKRTHVIGDRRDHFEAELDLWDMLMKIVMERKKREIDPTIQTLSDLVYQMETRGDVPDHVQERIGNMHRFLGTLGSWYDDVRRLPRPTLVSLMKMGGKVARFIPVRNQRRSGATRH